MFWLLVKIFAGLSLAAGAVLAAIVAYWAWEAATGRAEQ